MFQLNYNPISHGLMGFELGQPLLPQLKAIEAVRRAGFVGEMEVCPGDSGQFLLQKGSSPETQGFDCGLYFVCDSQGILVKFALALGVIPAEASRIGAAAAATRLKNFVIRELGAPAGFMDNIEPWSHQLRDSDAAYAAFWRVPTPSTDAPPVAAQDISGLVGAMKSEAQSLRAVVSISTSQGGVVAMLDLVSATAESPVMEQSLASKRREFILNRYGV